MTTKITSKQEIRDLLWKIMINPADTPGVSLNDTLQVVPGREHADGTVEMRIMDDPPGASVVQEGASYYLYYRGHIVASRPNDTWFWIVLDSAGYKAAKAFMEYRGDSSVRKEEWRSTTPSVMVKGEKEGKR